MTVISENKSHLGLQDFQKMPNTFRLIVCVFFLLLAQWEIFNKYSLVCPPPGDVMYTFYFSCFAFWTSWALCVANKWRVCVSVSRLFSLKAVNLNLKAFYIYMNNTTLNSCECQGIGIKGFRYIVSISINYLTERFESHQGTSELS